MFCFQSVDKQESCLPLYQLAEVLFTLLIADWLASFRAQYDIQESDSESDASDDTSESATFSSASTASLADDWALSHASCPAAFPDDLLEVYDEWEYLSDCGRDAYSAPCGVRFFMGDIATIRTDPAPGTNRSVSLFALLFHAKHHHAIFKLLLRQSSNAKSSFGVKTPDRLSSSVAFSFLVLHRSSAS